MSPRVGGRVGNNSLMTQSSLSNTQTLEEKFQVNNFVKMWPESNPFQQPHVRHGPQQQTESLSCRVLYLLFPYTNRYPFRDVFPVLGPSPTVPEPRCPQNQL